MIGPLTAFFFFRALAQSVEKQIPVTVVQPGDSVTLSCSGSYDINDRITWFKQTPGHSMKHMAQVYNNQVLQNSVTDKRFKFTIKDNLQVLNIQKITKEDEAIYYCQLTTGYGLDVISNIFLIVNDVENSQNCVDVRQSPSSASVPFGGSVSLECSLESKNNGTVQCPQHHKVHWFRTGSVNPLTGVMYNSTNSSCVYRVSKAVGYSSDTETYYCAVETCGRILFGDGTKVNSYEAHERLDPVTVVLSVLLSCSVLVIIVLCVCLRRVYTHGRDITDSINNPCDITTGPSQSTGGGPADVNYAALNFSSRKLKQSSKTRREQECVYSSVRADHPSSL